MAGCLGVATPSKVAASSSPGISSVAPSSGPTSGGTAVIISGNNFGAVAGVQFGGSPATAVQVENPTQIRVVVPPESKGSVAVTVMNSDGEIATEANAFTFINPPLQVTSTALPVGKIGAAFSAALAATGGTPPFGWREFLRRARFGASTRPWNFAALGNRTSFPLCGHRSSRNCGVLLSRRTAPWCWRSTIPFSCNS